MSLTEKYPEIYKKSKLLMELLFVRYAVLFLIFLFIPAEWENLIYVLTILATGVDLVLLVLDVNEWSKVGVKMPSFWWALIVPVYLWKRSNILETSKTPFWLYLCTITISTVFFIFYDASFDDDEAYYAELEQTACQIATDIARKNQYLRSLGKCISVSITSSYDYEHDGIATFSSGRTVRISISELKNNEVYVEFVN
ncbi:hypothetical protein [Suttonella ornithocola]|uniref:Uncharacterized protein n=1 Tax=Suttonella ornithocola TaxID=279832 RepID=A0A380N1L3_9GAMM|nr:hypothetical protein [Suttonella ornithocola]SUO97647.1 Uncharacterised protein [Suttonella ornithocola]